MSRRIERLAAASQIIKTDKGPVEALVTGAGPAIVVLHGALGGYDRARVYSYPEAGYTFICPSRPGYLRTPLTSGETAEEQADLTAALLDSLGIKKACVIACSAGGPPAIQFTLRHPDRCWGLVMGNAINAPLSRLHGLITPVARAFFGWDWFTWLGVNRGVLFLLRPNLGLQTIGDPAKQAHIKAMLDSMHPTSTRKAGLLNDMTQFQEHDGYPLEEISVPTLVVHGTADIVVPYSQGVISAERIPGAEFLSIEGGTHLCFISHQDIVQKKLVEFLHLHSSAN